MKLILVKLNAGGANASISEGEKKPLSFPFLTNINLSFTSIIFHSEKYSRFWDCATGPATQQPVFLPHPNLLSFGDLRKVSVQL